MNNLFWSSIHKSQLAHESIVGRLRAIEQLEKMSSYQGLSRTYFQRVKASLASIPSKHKESALLIFASVIYFPAIIMDESWRFLWFSFRQKYLRDSGIDEFVKRTQFFEIDQSGMINNFMHLNNIEGRLDIDSQVRATDIEKLYDRFCHLFNDDSSLRSRCAIDLRKLSQKDYWVILTDKSLSGQSLIKDLERYVEAANTLQKISNKKITIVVCAQIITEQALEQLDSSDKLREASLEIFYGALLGKKECMIKESLLVRDRSLIKKVHDCCEWFVGEYLDKDPLHDRTREKSGDNLALGYKRCALTVVDSSNCPTASLPLLWYRTPKDVKPYYCGPYPRTNSRIGDQVGESPVAGWEALLGKQEQIIERIQS